MNQRPLNIAIAGMGLIGGSLGLALKAYTDSFVIGIDIDDTVLDAALKSNAADEVGLQHLAKADILVLALAPNDMVEFLETNAGKLHKGAIVTDVCGVKHTVMKKCIPICREHDLHFVGGHPMAGREHGGFFNADVDLFKDAYYIFTPFDNTPDLIIELLKKLSYSIGCKGVTITTTEQHDRMIAFTSQLPHVLSGAYVKSPQCAEHKGFSAGSYRDVSRVATIDEHLWSQLFLQNADNLIFEIDTLIENLKQYRNSIASNDSVNLQKIIKDGCLRKEKYD